MMMNSFLNYCFCFLFGIIPLTLLSQDSPLSSDIWEVTESEFNKIKDQIDYSKTKKVIALVETQKKPPKKPPKGYNFLQLKLWQYLAYALILIILVFIVYTLFGAIKPNKKISAIHDPETAEHHQKVPLETLLEQAITAGDYRLAVRLQFIIVLEKLHQKNKINWHAEKTNRQYLNELSDPGLKASFRELAHIYEWVWYGNTALEAPEYLRFTPKFTHFLNSLA